MRLLPALRWVQAHTPGLRGRRCVPPLSLLLLFFVLFVGAGYCLRRRDRRRGRFQSCPGVAPRLLCYVEKKKKKTRERQRALQPRLGLANARTQNSISIHTRKHKHTGTIRLMKRKEKNERAYGSNAEQRGGVRAVKSGSSDGGFGGGERDMGLRRELHLSYGVMEARVHSFTHNVHKAASFSSFFLFLADLGNSALHCFFFPFLSNSPRVTPFSIPRPPKRGEQISTTSWRGEGEGVVHQQCDAYSTALCGGHTTQHFTVVVVVYFTENANGAERGERGRESAGEERSNGTKQKRGSGVCVCVRARAPLSSWVLRAHHRRTREEKRVGGGEQKVYSCVEEDGASAPRGVKLGQLQKQSGKGKRGQRCFRCGIYADISRERRKTECEAVEGKVEDAVTDGGRRATTLQRQHSGSATWLATHRVARGSPARGAQKRRTREANTHRQSKDPSGHHFP